MARAITELDQPVYTMVKDLNMKYRQINIEMHTAFSWALIIVLY